MAANPIGPHPRFRIVKPRVSDRNSGADRAPPIAWPRNECSCQMHAAVMSTCCLPGPACQGPAGTVCDLKIYATSHTNSEGLRSACFGGASRCLAIGFCREFVGTGQENSLAKLFVDSKGPLCLSGCRTHKTILTTDELGESPIQKPIVQIYNLNNYASI